MKRLLLTLAALALFASIAAFGSSQPVAAQGCSYSDGTVNCYGWEFEYEISSASVTPTGLTLNNLVFGGDSMMYQAHFASLPVEYDDDACGPYVDLFSTLTNSGPIGVQGGTFQQNGVNWLELGAHYQIGSYVLYTAFYFSDAGEMQMRIFARGLQCNVHHIHYPMFVVDTDVEGPNTTVGADGGTYHGVGDEVFYNNGATWVQQTNETDNNVSDVGHDFIVRDPDSGKTVSINYDDGIFAPPSGETFDPQAIANNKVYTRQSNGSAELAWPGAVPGRYFLSGSSGFNGGEWGYNDGEALSDPVVVVRGFLDHAISATLPDDWHTSGISVKLIDDPFNAGPTPTPTPTTTPGEPGPDNQLANGVPVSGISGDQGDELRYVLDVPANATSYTVEITGNGDADLYTRMGTAPTRQLYDCRPYEGGSYETCTRTVPPSGELHVMVHAYTDISNVVLTASYEGTVGPTPTATPTPTGPTPTPTPTPTPPPTTGTELTNGVPVSGISAPLNDELLYTFDVPADATSYTIAVSGFGDADLHTRMGGQASRSEYDCRPFAAGSNETCTGTVPPSGELSVLVHAYTAISNIQITATYDGAAGPTPTPTTPPVGPTPTPTPTPPTGANVLTNGVPVTGLSGQVQDELFYTFNVPSDATSYTVAITGEGDTDLHTRMGSQVSTSSYDCRPYLNGSTETCSGNVPPSGEVSIMLRGYTAFSNVRLVASYEGGGGGPAPTATPTPVPPPGGGGAQIITSGENVPGLSDSAGGARLYTIEVPAGSDLLRVRLTVGTGDADIYVRNGQDPTTSQFDCRAIQGGSSNETCNLNNPDAGTYHIMVLGYTAYSDTTLRATIS